MIGADQRACRGRLRKTLSKQTGEAPIRAIREKLARHTNDDANTPGTYLAKDSAGRCGTWWV